ncbi:MAG: hypothetical protein WDZ52_09235 [Pseudohongiellaceae bacterium]
MIDIKIEKPEDGKDKSELSAEELKRKADLDATVGRLLRQNAPVDPNQLNNDEDTTH